MRRFAPLVVFAVLVVVLLWPVLLGGRILLPGEAVSGAPPGNASGLREGVRCNPAWDSIARHYPARVFLGRAVRSGEIPLWNPHQMCGMPFLADARNAVFYPPNLLFAILPPDRAVGLLAALHLFAAGAFTYVFLKGLNLSRTASTFGGVAFMLGGFAVAWLELPGFLSAGVWLPLALYFSRLAHERRSAIHAAGAGTAVALAMVGGQSQIALYSILAVGLYWLYLAVSIRSLGAAWSWLWLAGLTFGLGFALAAPQLFPSAELAAASHSAASYPALSAQAMPARSLLALFVPGFFGRRAAECCGYVGILTLILVPFAFTGKRRQHAWFFGGLAALALLMALGAGINRLLQPGIPGLAYSGSPVRALYLFAFSAAVLGGIGLERITSAAEGKRLLAMLLVTLSALGVLAIGLILLQLNLSRVPDYIAVVDFLRAHTFLALFLTGMLLLVPMAAGRLGRELGGALAVAVLAADLIVFGMGYNPACGRLEVYPSTGLTNLLKEDADFSRIVRSDVDPDSFWSEKSVLLPNSATVYGLFDVQGFGPSYSMRCKELLDAAGWKGPNRAALARILASPIYDLLGIRWVVSDRPLRSGGRKIGGCWVYQNLHPVPRAFIVHMIEFADEKEILRRLVNAEADPRKVLLVRSDDAPRLAPWWIGSLSIVCKPARADRVNIVRYTCNTITLKVSATRHAFLVLMDQHCPGWQAFVDGRTAPMVRADYAFRAIAVPPGEHTVAFVYSPRSFAIGLRYAKVALVVLAGLAICSAAVWWGERGRS